MDDDEFLYLELEVDHDGVDSTIRAYSEDPDGAADAVLGLLKTKLDRMPRNKRINATSAIRYLVRQFLPGLPRLSSRERAELLAMINQDLNDAGAPFSVVAAAPAAMNSADWTVP